MKHKKELDKIIGNCKYGRLVFNKCGNDIYGIFNEYDDTDSANGFAYSDLKRGVIIRYSGETNKITKVREMKDGQQLMSATAQYVIYPSGRRSAPSAPWPAPGWTGCSAAQRRPGQRCSRI